MASIEARNNAAAAVPPVDAKAREDLRIRDAQGIPTHPAQGAAISGAAPVTPTPTPAPTVTPSAPYDPNVRTIDQAKNPYPGPAPDTSAENMLRNIVKFLRLH